MADLESLMTEQNSPDTPPEAFVDLPLQPTGSGVADLEIAYEQMKLAEGADLERAPEDARASDSGHVTPLGRDDNVVESEAHPS